MSARQDAIRRQYEDRTGGRGAAAVQRGFDGNGRPLPSVRPRNRFWRWFWLLFLISLLGGFLNWRESIRRWYAGLFERNGAVTTKERFENVVRDNADEAAVKGSSSKN